jgi:hypothetical protein
VVKWRDLIAEGSGHKPFYSCSRVRNRPPKRGKPTGNRMSEQIAFSPDEAAHRAGVGRTLIFAEIKRGKLEARKAGARTIITAEALTRWLTSLPLRTGEAA